MNMPAMGVTRSLLKSWEPGKEGFQMQGGSQRGFVPEGAPQPGEPFPGPHAATQRALLPGDGFARD